MNNRLCDYISLLDDFLEKKISAHDYQNRFFELFKKIPKETDDVLFNMLDELFGDTEVFEPDEELYKRLAQERPNWYLSEKEFRQRATLSLAKLRTYAAGHK